MLSASVERFLSSIGRAAKLEERYARLGGVGVGLSLELLRVDAFEQEVLYTRTARRLAWVRAARNRIAQNLAVIREADGLQIIGQNLPPAG